MGTWDSSTFGFIPIQYLGSNFTAGFVPSHDQCTAAYDNAGFIMGTSSTIFNQILLQVNATSLPNPFKSALNLLLGDLGSNNEDTAEYNPNPFFRYKRGTNPSANNRTLTLVDGGEDRQNAPLYPLIQPVREIDVVVAVDASADTHYNWPNGSSLVQICERSDAQTANGIAFPSIPDTNPVVNLRFNKRPSFFGSHASNITGTYLVPLLVYIPNAPYAAYSNISTLQLRTNDTQRDAIIRNGYDVATMANRTTEASWPMCVGCAILSRSFQRTGTPVPAACTPCFQTFCWDCILVPRHHTEDLNFVSRWTPTKAAFVTI